MNEHRSIARTLAHSRRVGELMGQPTVELVQRMTQHDLSKTQSPEVEHFDAAPPLDKLVYGSAEYEASRAALKPALDHHYANNRHHPENHEDGVAGMTLVDLIEMLADWKASTERVAGGDLSRSLVINGDRFAMKGQLLAILHNTAEQYGWL